MVVWQGFGCLVEWVLECECVVWVLEGEDVVLSECLICGDGSGGICSDFEQGKDVFLWLVVEG